MSMPLGSVQITKNTPTFFRAPFTGMKGIIVTNQSGLTCDVTMDGGNVHKTLQPGIIDWFPVDLGFTGTFIIKPSAILMNSTSFTASNLTFDGVGLHDSETPNSYPIQMTVPAVTTTASGKPIFSAGFFFNPTSTLKQKLNVFNPANSGVNFTFHSARCYTTSSVAANVAFIAFDPAPDLAFPTSVGAAAHLVQSSLPVSKSNCTAQDSAAALVATILELMPTVANTVFDFLVFPDVVVLAPGFNFFIGLSQASGSAGGQVSLTLKWTEDQILTS